MVGFIIVFILEEHGLIAIEKNMLRWQTDNRSHTGPGALSQSQREHLPATSFLSLTYSIQ